MLRRLFVLVLIAGPIGNMQLLASISDTIPCDESVRVPKTFCPNCEVWSDVFSPDFTKDLPMEYHLSIYDIDGIEIFSTESIDKGWNGLVKETEQRTLNFHWEMTYRYKKEGPLYTCTGMVVLIQ